MTTIQEWIQSTLEVDLPLGPSVEALLGRAELLCARLGNEPNERIATELQSDGDGPDVLHAMCQVLEKNGEVGTEDSFRQVRNGYEVAAQVTWEEETAERSELLAHLALIAWRHCRRFRTYPEVKEWESRCVAHTLSQHQIRDFVALLDSKLSKDLLRRFLSDSAVVLALCHKFEAERNDNFREAASQSIAVFEALENLSLPRNEEERAFFMADIAFSAACAVRHLGAFGASQVWLKRAEASYSRTWNPRPYEAIVDFALLTLACDRRELGVVLERAESVRDALRAWGIDRHSAAAGLLHAGALKDCGRLSEAATIYGELVECLEPTGETLLLGLALLNKAEVEAKLSTELELSGYRRAQEVLESQEVGWPLAQLQASIGEYLRDRGKLGDAVEAFRSSVISFESLGMKSRASYIRLLLAESLIANGRGGEAVREIGLALPVAGQQSVMTDIVAGVALLQEALRCSSPDPNADAELREKLRRTLKSKTQE